MAKNGISVKVKGVDSIRDVLKNKTPKDAINLSRAAFQAMATTVKNHIRSTLKGHQRTKNLYKSVKSKRLKSHPLKPTSAVVVQSNTSHPFYWRFLEVGTRHTPALHFIRKAKQDLEKQSDRLLEDSFKKVMIKRIKKNLKAARK